MYNETHFKKLFGIFDGVSCMMHEFLVLYYSERWNDNYSSVNARENEWP